MKALVIEDTKEMAEAISLCLSMRWPDTTVVSTLTGRKAAQLVESEAPDIVTLDLGLPDIDGLEVLKEIRSFSTVPVIIISARGEELARVKGLEMGADDYIVKPFSHTELLARVRAVLRRAHKPELWDDQGAVRGPGFVIDLARRRVFLNGQEVDLTPTEWSLLSYLIHNEGRAIATSTLAEKIWGTDSLSKSAITMCVRRLRLKLGDDPQNPRIIRSHRGIGYSYNTPQYR